MRRRRNSGRIDPHAYWPRPPIEVPRSVRADNFRFATARIGESLLVVLQATLDSVPQRGVLQPVDDNYWQALMLDPRGRTPADDTSFEPDSYFGYARLDRQPGRMLTVQCQCGQRQTFDLSTLIVSFGGDANVVWLARKIIDCGNRDKVANYCRAYVSR